MEQNNKEKVSIVYATWPSTGATFMQAFEDESRAVRKYQSLKSDSGAVVRFVRTDLLSIDDVAGSEYMTQPSVKNLQ